jgi:hypothetical protein
VATTALSEVNSSLLLDVLSNGLYCGRYPVAKALRIDLIGSWVVAWYHGGAE